MSLEVSIEILRSGKGHCLALALIDVTCVHALLGLAVQRGRQVAGQVVGRAEAPGATWMGALVGLDVSVGKDMELQLAPLLKRFLAAILGAGPADSPAHPAPVDLLVLNPHPFHGHYFWTHKAGFFLRLPKN